MLREKALRTSIIPSREVDLGQPEGIFIVTYQATNQLQDSLNKSMRELPVKAKSLSPMNMADSYWCLFRASCRQSLRNFSILKSKPCVLFQRLGFVGHYTSTIHHEALPNLYSCDLDEVHSRRVLGKRVWLGLRHLSLIVALRTPKLQFMISEQQKETQP